MVLILMVWCIDGAGCVEDLGEASRGYSHQSFWPITNAFMRLMYHHT